MHEEVHGSGGILVINDRNDQEENEENERSVRGLLCLSIK